MAEFFKFDEGWHFDDPRVKFDTLVPDGLTPDTPMPSADNQISVAMTAEQVTAFLAKLAEAVAMLPAIPEKTDAELKRLLGVDESTELDEIGAEALAAHPDWKPVRVVTAEYAKDCALVLTTMPMVTPTRALDRKITIMRRLASHDMRRATLAIYHVIADLAANGNVDAQAYYDRMRPFFERPGG
ncbi:MAG: hypothetical protein ABMA13_21125, partial [Chthoniobacteraceae bacterium]